MDADLQCSASWQWVAGCGADAAPFFRILILLPDKKFDPDGDYIRQYVPELTNMPSKYIHESWLAPQDILDSAGVILGSDYIILLLI